MVKTKQKSDLPWSTIFSVIVYYRCLRVYAFAARIRAREPGYTITVCLIEVKYLRVMWNRAFANSQLILKPIPGGVTWMYLDGEVPIFRESLQPV